MRKAAAIRAGKTDYDDSEYQDHKLTEENVGYQMVQMQGWQEGLGLGAQHQGIKVPINKYVCVCECMRACARRGWGE